MVDTLLLSPAMQMLLVTFFALACERFIPISSSIDPFAFFRFVCLRMAKKVLKANYTAQQLRLSGSLGMLVLVVPIIIIAYMLHSVASYQWLLNVMMLWIILQYTQHQHNVLKASTALNKGHKQLAKDLLQRSVLRRTAPLSAVGLYKAGVESLFLRYSHQQISVLVCFLLGGPILALAYRLCYECNQSWNTKQSEFSDFGALSCYLTQSVQFIPAVFTSVSLMLCSRPKSAITLLSKPLYWRSIGINTQGLLLHSLSQSLGIKSGGPIMYKQDKQNRVRYVASDRSSTEPNLNSIKALISLTNRHLILTLLIITGCLFCLEIFFITT